MIDYRVKESLEKLRRHRDRSLAYLLIRAGQELNDTALRRAASLVPSFAPREAHTRLLPFLAENEGIGITELASRVGVTKQAIQPLIADMMNAGLLRSAPDPRDGRAKRLYLTRAGLGAMNAGARVLDGVERDALLGLSKREVDELRSMLKRILEQLKTAENAE